MPHNHIPLALSIWKGIGLGSIGAGVATLGVSADVLPEWGKIPIALAALAVAIIALVASYRVFESSLKAMSVCSTSHAAAAEKQSEAMSKQATSMDHVAAEIRVLSEKIHKVVYIKQGKREGDIDEMGMVE